MAKKCTPPEIYKGKIIKENGNVIVIKLSKYKMKEFLDVVDATGLSIHKILSASGKPCSHCKGVTVKCKNNNGDEVEIRRGMLSDYHIQNNGINILKK